MNTYRITEEWDVFKKYLDEYLDHIDKTRVCYMHRDNEIYIRYSDDRIGDIIREKYTLIPSEAPVSVINDGWIFTGNVNLFSI